MEFAVDKTGNKMFGLIEMEHGFTGARLFATLERERIDTLVPRTCSSPPSVTPRPRVAPVAEERRVVAGDESGRVSRPAGELPRESFRSTHRASRWNSVGRCPP
jgi:hypothetical protein